MTFEEEDPRKRLSVRAEETLHEAIERFADEHSISKSDAVREAIREYIPDEEAAAPSDRKLRDAYQWLTQRADDHNHVPADLALSKLAQKYQLDKRFVKRLYLKPLDRKGWISARNGTLRIREPDDGESCGPTAEVNHE